jgi:hypothetical protein
MYVCAVEYRLCSPVLPKEELLTVQCDFCGESILPRVNSVVCKISRNRSGKCVLLGVQTWTMFQTKYMGTFTSIAKQSRYTPWWRLGHAPTALWPGERTPVPIGQEVGWAPEPVWTQRLEEKSFAPVRDRTSVARSSSP